MADKVVFSPCERHSNCTLRADFVPPGSPGFDASTDRKPVSAGVQLRAEEAFGSVFCVALDHIPGVLQVRRDDVG